MNDVGAIIGLHHVKVPVTDLARSREWYERVFDLEPKMEFQDPDGVVRGVSYQPQGGFALALREDTERARAMAGFDPFAILDENRHDLEAWAQRLDDLAVEHTPVAKGAMGWLFAFRDPDGLQLKLYTAEEHHEERPGRTRLPSHDMHDELELLTDSFVSAHNGRDWATMHALFTDDFYVVDHRPLGWGELRGAGAYIELLKTAIDLAPDRTFLKGEPILGAPAGMHRWIARGTDQSGCEVEWEFLGSFFARGDRFYHLELSATNDVDAAIARAERAREA